MCISNNYVRQAKSLHIPIVDPDDLRRYFTLKSNQFKLNPNNSAGSTTEDVKQFAVDIGNNLTLRCPIENTQDIVWVRDGKMDDQVKHSLVEDDGSLFLENVTRNDSGIYGCLPQNTVDLDLMKTVKVFVRSKSMRCNYYVS